MSTYASIEVEKLVLHGSDFTSNDAVPKYYVDDVVGSASSRIDTMLEGALPAFDTLVEIRNLMTSGDADVGTAMTAKISEIAGDLQTEVSDARGFEFALRNDIATEGQDRTRQYNELKAAADQELLDREYAVSGVSSELAAVKSRAEFKDQELQNQHDSTVAGNDTRFAGIETSVSAVESSVSGLSETVTEGLATKFDKAAGYSTRDDGALEINNDHYLYLGTNWRLRASQGGKRQRLEFEYSGEQATWDLAIPFIRGA